MTKKTHPIKFLIGVGGIYGAYMYYGIKQEKLFKTEYPTLDGGQSDKFRHSFMLLLIQCLFSSIVAFIVNLRNKQKTEVPFIEKFQMGFYNCVSMLGSNTALGFMSYPLQALFKSCKVLSVLIVGLIFGKTNYPMSQYICGVVVTAGIVLFNLCEKMKEGKETQLFGIVLILLSLFSDGMLAEKQNIMRTKYKPSSFELMEMCSTVCALLSLLYGIVTGSFFDCYTFIFSHKEILQDILIIGFLGCIGQIFIFFTIRHFGPVVLALVTTTRKFFTVLTSILFFGHNLFFGQWIGVLLVLLGVSFELYESYKKNSKSQKQKVEEDEKHSLVNGKNDSTHNNEDKNHSQNEQLLNKKLQKEQAQKPKNDIQVKRNL